jgi:hypothetical protein
MPIRPYLLEGAAFEPEAISVMSVAFESVRAELDLSDKDDPAMRLVAIRAERHPGCCTAAVHDTQGIQAQLVVEARRFPPPWTAEETGGLNSKAELPSTARATGAAAPAASPLGGDPPGLVAGEDVRCRAPSRLLLEIDVSERLSVGVADDETGVRFPRRTTAAGSGAGMAWSD